ncbi:hypothetical protein HXX76_008501 [Chlamydomonas incerta]|uniref:Uncharacterized protein n=1 Tax=Chlamydomonas incerta TaxID=51695 RepID=A0A835T410_CHLIN|nr:hypothetical protein HXX76_008501 [Chlamydomonas incerta]|eukprot:KAG2433444.1 hypothetical protein HXX76_008501 [Chlamydomonas incerta]
MAPESPSSQRNRRPLADPPAVARGLSAYPLMELRRGTSSSGRGLGGAVGSHAWLSACIRHIVTTAGARDQAGSQAGGAAAGNGAAPSSAGGSRGPSLHLVFSSPGGYSHSFQTLPLSHAVADNPQNWDQIAATVSQTGANGLVLVRPIPSPDQHCVFATAAAAASSAAAPAPAAPAAAASASPCSSSSCCSPSAACSPNGQLLPPPPCPTSSMEGEVGDCCGGSRSGGGDNAHSHSHSHEHATSSGTCPPGGAPAAAPTTAGAYCCPHTHYYGVVVQGAAPSDTDGCWVLKTSRSDAGSAGPHGGCTCTHFSLTRVCGGTPLYSQLRDAWLVPQQQQQQQQPATANSASAAGQQHAQLWH